MQEQAKFETRVAVGQDSHAFEELDTGKKLTLGGVVFEGCHGLKANSDGDVILHSVINSISGISGVNILGRIADEMCAAGITDSREYLREALKTLSKFKSYRINNISISIEAMKPKFGIRIEDIRKNLADILEMEISRVGITATSGEGLTNFGKGLGIQVITVISCDVEP
ncbi:MAG: 2-C-methyl-D-erythritol 2,4-cyclodiphosphate synthase [Clostridiales bacterium]|jgi:2-C-methyl-D-erythritol 2,4-cyclodiphosphate synthase|nr:2-C-methyl-D-erythritol 2,4-cyclodiphosphate synthase [Clostridiales bacterium]